MRSTNYLKVMDSTGIQTEKARKDGRQSREFVTLQLADLSNPLDPTTRTFNLFQASRQDKSGKWTNSWGNVAPLNLKGQTVKGAFVTKSALRGEIKPYDFNGMQISRTLVVLGDTAQDDFAAKADAVFAQQGFPAPADKEGTIAEAHAILAQNQAKRGTSAAAPAPAAAAVDTMNV